MSEKLIEEISEKVAEIWSDRKYDWRKLDIQVELGTLDKTTGKKSGVDITISCMYETPGCTFDQLTALANYFHTSRIDTIGEIDQEGCETCDYGSCYGFTLRVLPRLE